MPLLICPKIQRKLNLGKVSKTSWLTLTIQPILKLNSTSLCPIKKIVRWRVKSYPLGGGLGELSKFASWKCNFSIYLNIQIYYMDIQAITILLCLLFVLYVLVPSICSILYLTTAVLKSDIFRHSKAYSSHSFQSTGIRLGSLWRGNRCVLPIISAYL